MTLELRNADNKVICEMKDDTQTLASYGAQSLHIIHVIDSNPSELIDFNDLSQVEKYKISDEDYKKREGTFHEFKSKNQGTFGAIKQAKVEQ
jgi:tubulin-folding cofactor B